MCIFGRVSRSVIPVVSIHGVIADAGPTSINLKRITTVLEQAFETPNALAVAIEINSPGGSPVQAEKIHNRIRQLSAKHKVPVWTFIEDIGASGGYQIACAGDKVYASQNSIVGSIGVISSGFGFQDFIKRHGIERRVQTQGENKSVMDPFLPEKAEDVATLGAVGKDIHDAFIQVVKDRRGASLADDPSLFTGKFWSGRAAKELGLVDAIGSVQSVAEELEVEPQIKVLKEKKGLLHGILGLDTLFDGIVASVGAYLEGWAIRSPQAVQG